MMLTLTPVASNAENFRADDARDWYLYVFHLAYSRSAVTETAHYSISTGDAPAFPEGAWKVAVLNSRNAIIYSQMVDPAALAQHNGDLAIPYNNSGTTVVFTNASGGTPLSIDLSGSRVCDDNGSCDSPYGENAHTCPGDCGSISYSSPPVGTAAIAQQEASGRSVGQLVMQLSFAAAGLILLMGMVRMLDSRRRQ